VRPAGRRVTRRTTQVRRHRARGGSSARDARAAPAQIVRRRPRARRPRTGSSWRGPRGFEPPIYSKVVHGLERMGGGLLLRRRSQLSPGVTLIHVPSAGSRRAMGQSMPHVKRDVANGEVRPLAGQKVAHRCSRAKRVRKYRVPPRTRRESLRSSTVGILASSDVYSRSRYPSVTSRGVCVRGVSPLGHSFAPVFLQLRSPGCLAVRASEALVIPA